MKEKQNKRAKEMENQFDFEDDDHRSNPVPSSFISSAKPKPVSAADKNKQVPKINASKPAPASFGVNKAVASGSGVRPTGVRSTAQVGAKPATKAYVPPSRGPASVAAPKEERKISSITNSQSRV